MGDMLPGDGRIDLDDLGSVIEQATSVAPSDVLEAEADRPTTRERLERSGVLPWARRHRVVLWSAFAVVAVVGIAVGVVVPRIPPPQATSVEGAVVPWPLPGGAPGNVSVQMVSDTRASAGYAVRPARPGATLALEGITGPGLGDSSATIDRTARAGDADLAVVSSTIECHDPAALTATLDQFRIVASSTDEHGRTTHGTVPVPIDGFAFDWAAMVRAFCWQRAATTDLSVSVGDVSVDEGAGEVRVALHVESRLPLPASLVVDTYYDASTSIAATGASTLVPARSSADLSATIAVRDCGGGPSVPHVTMPLNGSTTAVHDVPGLALTVANPDGAVGGFAPTAFGDAEPRIAAALSSVCAGAPAAAVTRQTFGTPVFRDGGPGPTIRIPVTVRITTGARHQLGVRVSADPPDLASYDAIPVATTTLPAGGGTTTLSWDVQCEGILSPPMVDVRFLDGVQPFPRRLPLDQRSAEKALLAACPTVDHQTLVDNGWFAEKATSSSDDIGPLY